MTAIVFTALIAAEVLHVRRVRSIERLVFGAGTRPSVLARLAPGIRVVGVSALTWGIATLLTLPAERFDHGSAEATVDPTTLKRIVLMLDVSPSMDIVDADHHRITRRGRAATVILDLLSRFAFDRSRVSVFDFFGTVKPVVIDTIDPNVVKYIVWNDNVDNAFEDGETNLISSLGETFDLVKDWRPGSTTLVVLTDGDTTSNAMLARKPAAIDRVIFVGVGDPNHGTPIDGHLSRQESGGLEQLAARLNGTYFDANENLLPTDLLAESIGPMSETPIPPTALRVAAWVAIIVGSIGLLGLPIGLLFYGKTASKRQRPVDRAASSNHPTRGAA